MPPVLPVAAWAAGWAEPSSRPLDPLPLRRAFERFLITCRADYFPGGLRGLSTGFWFFLVLTGRDLASDSLRVPLHESLLFALLDAPVTPLIIFPFRILSMSLCPREEKKLAE